MESEVFATSRALSRLSFRSRTFLMKSPVSTPSRCARARKIARLASASGTSSISSSRSSSRPSPRSALRSVAACSFSASLRSKASTMSLFTKCGSSCCAWALLRCTSSARASCASAMSPAQKYSVAIEVHSFLKACKTSIGTPRSRSSFTGDGGSSWAAMSTPVCVLVSRARGIGDIACRRWCLAPAAPCHPSRPNVRNPPTRPLYNPGSSSPSQSLKAGAVCTQRAHRRSSCTPVGPRRSRKRGPAGQGPRRPSAGRKRQESWRRAQSISPAAAAAAAEGPTACWAAQPAVRTQGAADAQGLARGRRWSEERIEWRAARCNHQCLTMRAIALRASGALRPRPPHAPGAERARRKVALRGESFFVRSKIRLPVPPRSAPRADLAQIFPPVRSGPSAGSDRSAGRGGPRCRHGIVRTQGSMCGSAGVRWAAYRRWHSPGRAPGSVRARRPSWGPLRQDTA
eukprot:scaffold2408_cov386-Prasinococcus_capsulatus_cf.AAC.16